jgi:hypothetical protein
MAKSATAPIFRLDDIETEEVSLVDKAANGRKFLIVKLGSSVGKAKWTQMFENSLPDAAFAYIAPGGKKDFSGKTVPRSLRYLPHHGKNVKNGTDNDSIDKPHLRNALARVEQTKISPAAKASARKHLQTHAKALGIGGYGKKGLDVSGFEIFFDVDDGSDTITVKDLDGGHLTLTLGAKNKEDEVKNALTKTEETPPEGTEPPMAEEAPTTEAEAGAGVEDPGDGATEPEEVQKALATMAAVTSVLAKRYDLELRGMEQRNPTAKMMLRDGETYRDAVALCERSIKAVGDGLSGGPPDGYWHIKDVMEYSVVLGVWKGNSTYTLWSVPFARSAEGAFSFGAPEEVMMRTVYEKPIMAEPAATAKAAVAEAPTTPEAAPVAAATVEAPATPVGASRADAVEALASVAKAVQGAMSLAASIVQTTTAPVKKALSPSEASAALHSLRSQVNVNGQSGETAAPSSPTDRMVWPDDLNQDIGRNTTADRR